jgi:hypothetical protein
MVQSRNEGIRSGVRDSSCPLLCPISSLIAPRIQVHCTFAKLLPFSMPMLTFWVFLLFILEGYRSPSPLRNSFVDCFYELLRVSEVYPGCWLGWTPAFRTRALVMISSIGPEILSLVPSQFREIRMVHSSNIVMEREDRTQLVTCTLRISI